MPLAARPRQGARKLGVPWAAPLIRYGPTSTSTRVVRVGADARDRLAARSRQPRRVPALYRELGHRNHVAIGQALETDVSDEQFGDATKLVGQATLAEPDLAVHAAVNGVGVELNHARILLRWSLALGRSRMRIVFGALGTARPDHGVEIGAGEPTRVMASGVHPGAICAHFADGRLALLVPPVPSFCQPIWSPKAGPTLREGQARSLGGAASAWAQPVRWTPTSPPTRWPVSSRRP